MGRITADEYFMEMVRVVAKRATCIRRQVGCILVNHRNHIVATGYNGNAAGTQHCIDHPCAGAHAPSGQSLDLCEAIHAESNALLQCKNVFEIHTAYVTASPCIHCVKLLLNTSCKRIVFLEPYPHSKSEQLWISNEGRTWEHFKL